MDIYALASNEVSTPTAPAGDCDGFGSGSGSGSSRHGGRRAPAKGTGRTDDDDG